MKGEQDGWTERRERGTKGRQQNARRRRWRIIKGGREREPHHGNQQHQCSCTTTAPWPRAVNCKEADRKRWRERVEGRKNGRKKVKAMDGGSNRARDQRVGTTERLRRDACERQKGGEIERDG